jgi:hypothetical protein
VDLFVVYRGLLGHLCSFAIVKGTVASEGCGLRWFLIFFLSRMVIYNLDFFYDPLPHLAN